MKKQLPLFILLISITAVFAQQPYYDDVNINLTGQDLYFELQNKISNHNTNYTYGDVRDDVRITDEDTDNGNNVLLVYGYDDSGSCKTDRTRDKDDYGGSTCEYNREHVFARSNANPSMGDTNNSYTGIVADPHNIRPSDQQMNGDRGNKKFTDGSGNPGNVGSNWYPGDEWKGDVARMMMYMYTRYGDRCLPSLNGTGATQGSTDMLEIYLQWNVEDPVNEFEDQRNPHLQNVYGNRNPFIDNPYLATIIWGGEPAEDRWGLLETNDLLLESVAVYPNPISEILVIQNSQDLEGDIILYNILGKVVLEDEIESTSTSLDVSSLQSGLYLLRLSSNGQQKTQKVIIQ